MDPETIYITEEFGPSEFPNSEGKFPALENITEERSYEVEGEPISRSNTANSSQAEADVPTSTSSGIPDELGAFRRTSSG